MSRQVFFGQSQPLVRPARLLPKPPRHQLTLKSKQTRQQTQMTRPAQPVFKIQTMAGTRRQALIGQLKHPLTKQVQTKAGNGQHGQQEIQNPHTNETANMVESP